MKDLSLKAKLFLSSFMICMILLGVGLFSVYTVKKLSASFDHPLTINMANNENLATMRGRARETLGLLLHTGMAGNPQSERERVYKKLMDSIKAYEEADRSYGTTQFAPGEEELYRKVQAQWVSMSDYINKSAPFAVSGKPDDLVAFSEMYRGDFTKVRQAYFNSLDDLLALNKAETSKWRSQAESIARNSFVITLAIVAIGVLIGLIISFILASRLSAALASIARQVSSEADSLNKASGSITNLSQNLSSSVSEQAAAIQETSASIQQITAMVSKSSENAERSKEISTASQEQATQGKQAVHQMAEAMHEIEHSHSKINSAVETSNKQFAEIIQVMADIDSKTKVIHDIVFQTKLLSFNASVEAARAGENGKGFAVVAEEVGNLAIMSGKAAEEISTMLADSVRKVQEIVDQTQKAIGGLVEDGYSKVVQGRDVAQRCGDVLERLVEQVEAVGNSLNEIAAASREQSSGVSEINRAISEMDTVTQQNSATAEQAATAASGVREQADALRHSVHDLMKLVQGHDSRYEDAPSHHEAEVVPMKLKKAA